MVRMAFCDLSLTFQKQVTSVSPACFCHPAVENFDVSPNTMAVTGKSRNLHIVAGIFSLDTLYLAGKTPL